MFDEKKLIFSHLFISCQTKWNRHTEKHNPTKAMSWMLSGYLFKLSFSFFPSLSCVHSVALINLETSLTKLKDACLQHQHMNTHKSQMHRRHLCCNTELCQSYRSKVFSWKLVVSLFCVFSCVCFGKVDTRAVYHTPKGRSQSSHQERSLWVDLGKCHLLRK